jgi:hypothetical protein
VSSPTIDDTISRLSHDRDLGGGIGVILRMIYVLMVVTYRMFRGPAQPGEDDADEEEAGFARRCSARVQQGREGRFVDNAVLTSYASV